MIYRFIILLIKYLQNLVGAIRVPQLYNDFDRMSVSTILLDFTHFYQMIEDQKNDFELVMEARSINDPSDE